MDRIRKSSQSDLAEVLSPSMQHQSQLATADNKFHVDNSNDFITWQGVKQGEFEIHANPGKVFDCVCKVGVECDEETIALRFPQIDRDDDNIGPMVYAYMLGTELRVTLCNREDADIEFAWDEGSNVWRPCDTANSAICGKSVKETTK